MTVVLSYKTGKRSGLIGLPLEEQESTFGLKYIKMQSKDKSTLARPIVLSELVQLIYYRVLDENLFMLAAIKHGLEFQTLDSTKTSD